ncbi:MAG: biotin/lipoyl-binding protein [Planctomycetaceae bacterium]|jgi:putative peptide zinc metalloprotease protein|nr:biotin/lipoyl-binding protein [Planctomycetaceae bacterium]
MVSLTDSLVSSSARKLPIKIRPDLGSRKHQYQGRSYWVVKDPVGSKYFRFQEEEFAILQLLDGSRSLDEVKEDFESQFPPQKITLDELQSFIGQLHQSGLILAGVQNQGHELNKRGKKKQRQMLIAAVSNILAVRFKGIDPNSLLTWLEPKFRFMFYPVTVFLCMVLWASAAGLILVEFDQFRSKLPGFQSFFSPSNIFLLSVMLGITKIIHEFGHGITCKHFGGDCHEMGVMLLVLTPCLYVNVSDSWMIPSKWKRAMIGAAGVYVECTLAAICTFLWWFSRPGLFNYLCLNVMFISSVSTIVFNINPLLRYDGYYILADLLEIPNLRQKATKILSKKSMEWFLGMEQPDDPFLPKRNQGLFIAYTIAAVCYRWVVMASILFFVYKIFQSVGLRVVAQMIAVMSLYGLLVMPVIQMIKFFYVPGRIYKVKRVRFLLSLSVIVGLIALILFYPLPYRVYAPFTVQLQQDAKQIYVPTKGGILTSLNVQAGQQVSAGQVLGQLTNLELQMEIQDLNAQVKKAEEDLKNLYLEQNIDQTAGAQIPQVEETLLALQGQLEEKKRELQEMTLAAPIAGTVIPPEWRTYRELPGGQLSGWWGTPLEPRNTGASLERGTLFCEVGDPAKMEVIIVLNQDNINFVMPGQKVEMMFVEYPGVRFGGTVKDVESRQMETIPTQLSTKGKGEVPTKTDTDNTEKPSSPSYRVSVLLDNPDRLIHVGMTGRGKIHVAPQTLGQRAWRIVMQVFNFKLQ